MIHITGPTTTAPVEPVVEELAWEVPKPVLRAKEMRAIMAATWADFAKHGVSHEKNGHKHIHVQRGKSKVLGVAHLDTVRPYSHFWMNDSYVGCPTLDNRLGAWVLIQGLTDMGITLDLLLCDEEERGNSTAQDFVVPEGVEYNWMVSFDRMGMGDCALYQYESPAVKAMLKPFGINGVKGSYSDIDSAGHLGILGFNWGCGMQDYHSDSSYASLFALRTQMERFARFFETHKDIKLPYEQPQWQRFHRTRQLQVQRQAWSGETDGEWGVIPRRSIHQPVSAQVGEVLAAAIDRLNDVADDEDRYDQWQDFISSYNQGRQKARRARDEKEPPTRDEELARELYGNFEEFGLRCHFFEQKHPLIWCKDNEMPKDTAAGWANGCVACARCGRKFPPIKTRWLYCKKHDYCRYCYCTELEQLGFMPKEWYVYATTLPGNRDDAALLGTD